MWFQITETYEGGKINLPSHTLPWSPGVLWVLSKTHLEVRAQVGVKPSVLSFALQPGATWSQVAISPWELGHSLLPQHTPAKADWYTGIPAYFPPPWRSHLGDFPKAIFCTFSLVSGHWGKSRATSFAANSGHPEFSLLQSCFSENHTFSHQLSLCLCVSAHSKYVCCFSFLATLRHKEFPLQGSDPRLSHDRSCSNIKSLTHLGLHRSAPEMLILLRSSGNSLNFFIFYFLFLISL